MVSGFTVVSDDTRKRMRGGYDVLSTRIFDEPAPRTCNPIRKRSVSLSFANSAALLSASRTVSDLISDAWKVFDPRRRLVRYSGAIVAVSVSVAAVSISKASIVIGVVGFVTRVSMRKMIVALSTLRIRLSVDAPTIR